jgi:phenylalanyl-tRNA synthetase alpha chain
MAQARNYPELALLLDQIATIRTQDAPGLEALRIALVGRKQGKLTEYFRAVPTKPVDERRDYGSALNEVKQALEEAFQAREDELRKSAPSAAMDLTMPGRRRWVGADHPLSKVIEEICEIFKELGFAIAVGPEVEDEWLNFFALNFPKDHPALDAHDTMYLNEADETGVTGVTGETRRGGRLLLRTHTSPVQIRVMQGGPPPYRVVIPGMVYRNDPFDASHAPAFAQIEGLAVDEGIGMVDLKATLLQFARRFFFGSGLRTSPSPSHRASWMSNVRSAEARGARPARPQGGWRSWGAAWCTLTSSPIAASTPSDTRAGRSGWAPGGWR